VSRTKGRADADVKAEWGKSSDCEFSCSEMDGTILAVVVLEKFHAETAAYGSFGDVAFYLALP
jgi:hypothetical protein